MSVIKTPALRGHNIQDSRWRWRPFSLSTPQRFFWPLLPETSLIRGHFFSFQTVTFISAQQVWYNQLTSGQNVKSDSVYSFTLRLYQLNIINNTFATFTVHDAHIWPFNCQSAYIRHRWMQPISFGISPYPSNHLRCQWSFSREELIPDLRDPYCSQQLWRKFKNMHIRLVGDSRLILVWLNGVWTTMDWWPAPVPSCLVDSQKVTNFAV